MKAFIQKLFLVSLWINPVVGFSKGMRSSIWHPSTNPNNYLQTLESNKKSVRPKFRHRLEKEHYKRRKNKNEPIQEKVIIPLQPPLFQLIFNGLQNQTFPALKPRNASKNTDTSESGSFQLENLQGKYNFTNIGGYQELKQELHQILDLIQNHQNYSQYGIRIPRGILLEGPPGNGKTLIAKCLAGEASMNFISCVGSEFNEKYVGVGSAKLRELFQFAKKNKPCTIFIDEIDAVGRKRSDSNDGAHAERDTTLNQLLVNLDGFSTSEGILVICATNRVDILDSALLRPGRMDKILHVPNPDSDTRREILNIHSYNKPINASLEYLVKMTKGMSGAQIENLLNEATLLALRNQTLPISTRILDWTKEKILIGQSTDQKQRLSANQLYRVAIHEIGHLYMAIMSTHYETPWKVTIHSINSKHSLGYTIFEPSENDAELFLREYYEDKIKVLLGGRIAEEVFFGNSISSGAVSDFETAFAVAKKMVMEYGMGAFPFYPYFSESFKRRIDQQIHSILTAKYKETKQILEKNKNILSSWADKLVEKESLYYDDIQELLQQME